MTPLIPDPPPGKALWLCHPRNGTAEWLVNPDDHPKLLALGEITVNGELAYVLPGPPDGIRPNTIRLVFPDTSSDTFDPKPTDAGRWKE